ncbi:MAG: hypothetical protein SNG97_07030 [Rikenellaceae bacterium]
MFRLHQRITIGGKVLPFVGDVVLNSSRNNFTATAQITLPNRIAERGKRISDVIEQGSAITIELGYFPNLNVEFEGYISQVMPDRVCTIMCEDEAYIAKRKSIGKDIIQKATTIKALIAACYNGEFECIDANIGDWKVSKSATVLDVLSDMQNKFKVFSYFRGKTLIVGVQADTHISQGITCDFQRNVPLGESSFSFADVAADRVIVKASAINREGVISEVYAYYVNQDIEYSSVAPEVGKINEFNINGQSDITTDDLRALARIRLEALSYMGAEGSIAIFGSPIAAHGDYAVISDSRVPEKNGRYSIVEVEKSFGANGFRQVLNLGVDYGD